MLQSLPRSVVGLALVPVEARRILATRPLTTKDAFAGLRIRIIDNPQTAADLRSVGALPVQRLDAHQAGNLLDANDSTAVESSPTNILVNGYQTVARYFTTYSPFAKFQTIVVSRQVWDQLSAEQQEQLRAAARATVVAASPVRPQGRATGADQLCEAEGFPRDLPPASSDRSQQRCGRPYRSSVSGPPATSSSSHFSACRAPACSRSRRRCLPGAPGRVELRSPPRIAVARRFRPASTPSPIPIRTGWPAA